MDTETTDLHGKFLIRVFPFSSVYKLFIVFVSLPPELKLDHPAVEAKQRRPDQDEHDRPNDGDLLPSHGDHRAAGQGGEEESCEGE